MQIQISEKQQDDLIKAWLYFIVLSDDQKLLADLKGIFGERREEDDSEDIALLIFHIIKDPNKKLTTRKRMVQKAANAVPSIIEEFINRSIQ